MEELGDDIPKILSDIGTPVKFKTVADPERGGKICECVDPVYHQPKPDCPICKGTGYIYGTGPYQEYDILAIVDIVKSADLWTRVGKLVRGDALAIIGPEIEPKTGDIMILPDGKEFGVLYVMPVWAHGKIKFYELEMKPRIMAS